MASPISGLLSLSPYPDSGTQPGGVPSAPTGPLGPPGHGQTLGKSEGIRAGRALGREGVGPNGWAEGGPGSRLHQTRPPGSTLIQLPSLPPEFMHAVAHQITHQAMVAAVASAAAGNNLEGEVWEAGHGPRGGCRWLAVRGPAFSPLRSLPSATHRTAGAGFPDSSDPGGDCSAYPSTGSAFPSWGAPNLGYSSE